MLELLNLRIVNRCVKTRCVLHLGFAGLSSIIHGYSRPTIIIYILYAYSLKIGYSRIGIWGRIQFTDSVIVCNEAKSSFTFTDPVNS